MTKILTIAALALASITFSTQSGLADDRQQEIMDCMSDAFRVCGQFIPDEAKTGACMVQNKAKLSKACQRHIH